MPTDKFGNKTSPDNSRKEESAWKFTLIRDISKIREIAIVAQNEVGKSRPRTATPKMDRPPPPVKNLRQVARTADSVTVAWTLQSKAKSVVSVGAPVSVRTHRLKAAQKGEEAKRRFGIFSSDRDELDGDLIRSPRVINDEEYQVNGLSLNSVVTIQVRARNTETRMDSHPVRIDAQTSERPAAVRRLAQDWGAGAVGGATLRWMVADPDGARVEACSVIV